MPDERHDALCNASLHALRLAGRSFGQHVCINLGVVS